MRQRVASGGVAAPFTLRRTLKHNDVGGGMENECVFLTQYVILHEMYVGSVAQSCQSGNPYEIKRPHAPASLTSTTGEALCVHGRTRLVLLPAAKSVSKHLTTFLTESLNYR